MYCTFLRSINCLSTDRGYGQNIRLMRGMGGGDIWPVQKLFSRMINKADVLFASQEGCMIWSLASMIIFLASDQNAAGVVLPPPPLPHPKLDCPPFKPNSTVPGVVVMVTPVAIHQLLSGTSYNPSQKSLATLRRKPSPASPLSMLLQ